MEITHGKRPPNLSNPYFKVGTAAAEFSPGGDRGWRKKETTVGNLFTDSIAWYMRKLYPQDPVDFVLMPARAVAKGHAKGDITVGSLELLVNTASYGYDWSCSLITVTGSQVIELFQAAANVGHDGGGGHGTGAFGLVSKEVQHTIDYTTRGDSPDAIKRGVTRELVINGVTFVHDLVPTTDRAILDKTYRVATLEYILLGSDDFDYYETFEKGTNWFRTRVSTAQCMAYYVYDFDAPLVPVLDGRIKLIGGVPIP
jgi:2',3'-cyclic-nucleotide 2'-phosphodiesterase (5'-nucleotidase family)